ncbi:MAG TPA: heparan-alpha-glucosaminide N-acetyltransferase, partial [Pseudorhizobium sp.]|nr:heparan-alpha-glucosaminide N-acetyltransferase [Pseudorhizobium sp.]
MTLAVGQTPSPAVPRITVIDTLRGVALLAMASYHFTWDLEFFGYLEPGTATHGWWKIYARAIASSFLFLAGISLVLAHYPAIRWRSFWKRFAMVAGAALAISIATFIAVRGAWIFFGILHCIAVASLAGLAFVRLPALVSGAS